MRPGRRGSLDVSDNSATVRHMTTRGARARTRAPIGMRVLNNSEIVHLGTAPGEQFGWECAICQGVSGLAFGDGDTAKLALDSHILSDCVTT